SPAVHFLQHTERAMYGARGAVLCVSFNPAGEVPARMRREIRNAKWEIAGPAAYPMLMALNTPGGGVQGPQLEVLVRLLAALPRFVALRRKRAGGAGAKKALHWKDKAAAVTLTFTPQPRLVWADLFRR
ncbi:MAG: hypothetical protein ACREOG_18175, partial [Gemmatimonadaceae bacterium]